MTRSCTAAPWVLRPSEQLTVQYQWKVPRQASVHPWSKIWHPCLMAIYATWPRFLYTNFGLWTELRHKAFPQHCPFITGPWKRQNFTPHKASETHIEKWRFLVVFSGHHGHSDAVGRDLGVSAHEISHCVPSRHTWAKVVTHSHGALMHLPCRRLQLCHNTGSTAMFRLVTGWLSQGASVGLRTWHHNRRSEAPWRHLLQWLFQYQYGFAVQCNCSSIWNLHFNIGFWKNLGGLL